MKRATPSRVSVFVFAAAVASCTLGLVVSACSDDDGGARSSSGIVLPPEGGSAGDGGAVDSSAPSRPELCTGLELGGEVVQENALAGDPPPPLGGTIGPGTYDLSELDVYGQAPDASPGEDGGEEIPGNPLTGKAARATIVISNSYLRFIEARGTPENLGAQSVRTIVNKTDGTSIVGSQLCPTSAPPKMLPFSAVGTGLAIYPDPNHREVYIRR